MTTTTNNDRVIATIQSWSSPILLMIIGFLAKSKLDVIDAKLDQLTALQTQQAVISMKVDNVERGLDGINARFDNHLAAMKPEEITIKPKR